MVEQLLQQVRIGVRRLGLGVLARPFVRNVGVLTIANGVGAVLSLVQGILVARWLGPELYGVAALVMSIPALVYTFFDARSAEASVRFLSEFDARGERERALAMCKVGYAVDFAISGAALLVVLLLAPWAAKSIVRRPEMEGLIGLYGCAFLARALVGTSYAVLATLGRFPTIALIDTLTNVLRVGLVLGLVGLGWQVAGVVWGNTIAIVATGLIYGACTYAVVKSRWGQSWLSGNWHHLKGRRREILGFLAYNDLNALIGLIPKQLDVVLLGYFCTPIEVGYYRLAKGFASFVNYIVGPLQSVAYPELSRTPALGSVNQLKGKIRKIVLQTSLPLGLAVMGAVLVVPSILPILVGKNYQPAVLTAQVLMFGYGIYLTLFWLRPVYLAAKMVKKWTTIISSFAVFTLIGWLILVPLYGHVGVAAWWTFSVIVIYLGLGVLLLLFSTDSSRGKPTWDEYTANLVAKAAVTATDWELLFRYAKGRVLDVGCGNGITLFRIFQNCKTNFNVGIDLGLSGLIYAKQNFPEIEYIQSSAYRLPFSDCQFDFIYMIDVIEHLDQPQLAIKEMYRVCKIGGYVFVQTPNYPVKRIYDFWHAIRGSRSSWKDDPTHVSRFNAWKLVRMMHEVGFHIEQVKARNIPFRIDEKFPFITPWVGRHSLIGKLFGQKIIVIAVKK